MEITEYVSRNPGCSAADIVDHLSNTLRMRNHGLTSRKVGSFIPRYLKNIVDSNLTAQLARESTACPEKVKSLLVLARLDERSLSRGTVAVSDKSIGRQPCFPSGPVWSVLPTLKGQIADMLADVGEKGRIGVSIDSSNGLVHIHESATIEPSVHIIGPAYIGPSAIIRHGAYIREFSDLWRKS